MEDLKVKLKNINAFVEKRNAEIVGLDQGVWTLEDELKSLDRLYESALALVRTEPIEPADAQAYHNYHKLKRTSPDTTTAVYLTLSEIFATIIDRFGDHEMGDGKYNEAAIFAYLIRYNKDVDAMRRKDQTSIVIQVAKDNGSGEPTAFPPLYNLGDLCPPKCPSPSTIIIQP